jgi:chemotaxis protein MotB
MKKFMTTAACICLATVFLTSCVAKRKYIAATSRADQAHAENLSLNSRITRLEDTISMLHNKLGALGNANENTTNELYKTSNELNLTKDQIASQRARLQQLQAFIAQQQSASEALKKKIAEALIGFTASELLVTLKNGRVYISMQETLLFPSGSAVVNPRGKEALAKVAAVLNTSPDVNINIEGHTDNVPIHTKTYPDNWTLSTARATSIAHVLIDEYSVTPAKLIASGRASYDPIAINTSPEGRAQNRRTEIILEPKLDELMQLMSTSAGK